MSERDDAAEGPLYRATLRRAGEVDEATTPRQRRKAWTRLIATGVVAFAESYVRDSLVWGAVLFSAVAAGFGASSGDVAWAIPLVAAGPAGIALVFLALARRWSYRRQWAVLLGVPAVQAALIVALWQTS